MKELTWKLNEYKLLRTIENNKEKSQQNNITTNKTKSLLYKINKLY